jgi:iron only hydrogenase large subunit-like protein/uncharacterized Fe-S cluster-containing protein
VRYMDVINFARANCKNCYKCIRACPVKAIQMKDHQAEIIDERCVICGTCLTICPQNAKTVKSDVENIKRLLDDCDDVVVSLAPSFAGAFVFNRYNQMIRALKRLGFSKIYQTSVGARLIAGDYVKYYNDKTRTNLITTACPAVNYLIQKYYPELVKYMIPVVSPMEAHGRYLKKVKGHSKVIFVGPCIAKKEEIYDNYESAIDGVLTFEEIKAWWKEKGIEPIMEEIGENEDTFCDDANLYPIPGSAFKTIEPLLEEKWRSFISVDGLDNCMTLLEELKAGEFSGTWIEINACEGSCSNGPALGDVGWKLFKRLEKIKDFASASSTAATANAKYFSSEDICTLNFSKVYSPIGIEIKQPSEEEIKQILSKIGKNRPEDELNCGACGYNTCRDKAVAVYNKMAETYMCIPYMRTRAESLSNIIIESGPNAIIAVDLDMKIQEYNPAAKEMFRIKDDLKYKPLRFLLNDDDAFRIVAKTQENIVNKKVTLEEYGLITLQNIYYLKDHNIVIGIITDITDMEKIREKNIDVRKKTIETTQEVIEKQMRVAQEIASVLGETTAETKVMLNKIKRLLIDEMPGDDDENKD